MGNLRELIEKNRSYRRFDQSAGITTAQLEKWIELRIPETFFHWLLIVPDEHKPELHNLLLPIRLTFLQCYETE